MPSILPAFTLPDHSIQISLDRGGTWCDGVASWPNADGERKEIVVKLLSQDPAHYPDAPTEACRRVLELATGTKVPRGQKLDVSKFDYIRLSTTVATKCVLILLPFLPFTLLPLTLTRTAHCSSAREPSMRSS